MVTSRLEEMDQIWKAGFLLPTSVRWKIVFWQSYRFSRNFLLIKKQVFHPILYCATCKIKRGRPTLHDYTFSFRVEASLIIAYLAAMVKNWVEDSSIWDKICWVVRNKLKSNTYMHHTPYRAKLSLIPRLPYWSGNGTATTHDREYCYENTWVTDVSLKSLPQSVLDNNTASQYKVS